MNDAKSVEVETSNASTKQASDVDTKNVDVETADDKEDNNVKPKDDTLLCGMKRRTAYIAIAITTILVAIGITLAVIYGRPADWKSQNEYVGGPNFGNVQMISSDGSTLAVIEEGDSADVRAVQVIPTTSSNISDAVRLSPFFNNDDYPLPVNSEYKDYSDPENDYYFDPYGSYYDLSLSGDGNTIVVLGMAYMYDNFRLGGLGYHALCNSTAVNVTNRYDDGYRAECVYSRATVFKRKSSDSNDNEWDILGASIEHMMENDRYTQPEFKGRREVVSLSNDGKTFAIGYIGGVDVYKLTDGESWEKKGNSILVPDSFKSLSLSSDGERIATGSGVYEYDQAVDSWTVLGMKLPAASPQTVSLSGSGNRLAVTSGIQASACIIEVYDYDMDSDTWMQVGSNISGFAECYHGGGSAGKEVALSLDGKTVVYPASFAKLVQPYRFDGKVWSSVGKALDSGRGDTPTASITGNGDRLVIGEVAFFSGESYVSIYDLRRGI